MRRRISIRGRVRPSIRPSVCLSRVIFKRVLGASCAVYPALFIMYFLSSGLQTELFRYLHLSSRLQTEHLYYLHKKPMFFIKHFDE